MEVEELVNAVKEAVDERLESEKDANLEAVKEVVGELLEPFSARLEKVEEALEITVSEANKALGASKAIVGQDINDGGVATKSDDKPRRDGWGRRIRS